MIVNSILLLASAALLLPILMLFIECLAGSLALRRLKNDTASTSFGGARPKIDVLVPAHNEQQGLARTLQSIAPQLRGGDRLCVVADNCRDATASIAQSMKAMVVERNDQHRHGKGYALAAGLAHLSDQAGDVVIMIDADCEVMPGALQALALAADEYDRPVQADYRMANSDHADGWSAISAFAVRVKNQLRPLGLNQIGLGCTLTGSGMAFPWSIASRTPWAGGGIVEDLAISLQLIAAGTKPLFCPAARVRALLPASRDTAMAQRRRWEQGHMQMVCRYLPGLLASAILRARFSLFGTALDLLVLPVAMLWQVWLLCFLVTLIAAALGTSWLPFAVSICAGLLLLSTMLIAWLAVGRQLVALRHIVQFPIYIASKLPIYVSALYRRQRDWNRTAREPAA